MSRSYKKTFYCGDKKSKEVKRIANHRVRQRLKNPDENLPFMSYKKVFCSYDICDYYSTYSSFEEYYEQQIYMYQRWKKLPYPTREECWKEFIKYFRNK